MVALFKPALLTTQDVFSGGQVSAIRWLKAYRSCDERLFFPFSNRVSE